MSKKMKVVKNLFACVFACVLFLLVLNMLFVNSGVSSPGDPTFKVTPTNTYYSLGDQYFEVQVNACDLVSPGIWSWQVFFDWGDVWVAEREYGPVSVVSVEYGDFFPGSPGTLTRIANDQGFVMISAKGDQENPVYGSGWLCNVTFLISPPGNAHLNISNTLTFGLDPWMNEVHPVKEDGYFWGLWYEDINMDGVVDIFDVCSVAIYSGSFPVQQKEPSSDTGDATWLTSYDAYSSNDYWARCATAGAVRKYTGYGYDTTGWSGVSKVEVGLELKTIAGGNDKIEIAVSNDGGASFSGTTVTVVMDGETSDIFAWHDFTSAYSWTPGGVQQIAVRLTCVKAGGSVEMIYVDYVPVRVTPTPTAPGPVDVNRDGKVNILDLARVCIRYGYIWYY